MHPLPVRGVQGRAAGRADPPGGLGRREPREGEVVVREGWVHALHKGVRRRGRLRQRAGLRVEHVHNVNADDDEDEKAAKPKPNAEP